MTNTPSVASVIRQVRDMNPTREKTSFLQLYVGVPRLTRTLTPVGNLHRITLRPPRHAGKVKKKSIRQESQKMRPREERLGAKNGSHTPPGLGARRCEAPPPALRHPGNETPGDGPDAEIVPVDPRMFASHQKRGRQRSSSYQKNAQSALPSSNCTEKGPP